LHIPINFCFSFPVCITVLIFNRAYITIYPCQVIYQINLLLGFPFILIYQFCFTEMAKISLPLAGLVFLCVLAVMVEAEGEYMKYKDPKQHTNARIRDLMKRMTLEEKIGQMVQADFSVVSREIMRNYSIGSVLSGGGSTPRPNATPLDWINMINDFQNGSLSSRLGIPMIYGIDAVHGHNNVYKATVFPHNVGLGVTRQVFFC
jgi:beta-glucosidase